VIWGKIFEMEDYNRVPLSKRTSEASTLLFPLDKLPNSSPHATISPLRERQMRTEGKRERGR